MHYIRFLKTPKVVFEGANVTLNAVVTITTDLGETFYPDNVSLAATVRSAEEDGDIYLRRTINWAAGMRSLPISIAITRSELDWPARLHVGLKNGAQSDHFEAHHSHGDLPSIISVWSEPMTLTKGRVETTTRVERKFTPLSGRTLSIYEDTGDSIARHLWDGSLALTTYIDRLVALQAPSELPLLESALVAATYKKLNVLELGCGCGVVGISLAQAIPDTDVLLTDLPEVDELVERNIQAMNPAIKSKVAFAPLDWENPLPPKVQGRTFDVIIAAECIYNTDSIPPLVKTLAALLARSPRAIVVVSTKVRHDSEALFHELAAKEGLIGNGRIALPLAGQPGYGYGDSATQVDVYVFHGKNYRQAYSPDIELDLDY